MIANDVKSRRSRTAAPNAYSRRAWRNLREPELHRSAHPLPLQEARPNLRVENALVRKLRSFVRLSYAELDCLAQIQSNSQKIAAKTDLVHEGQFGHHAYILQSGWAYSYKLLPDGGRQIITFLVPGDFVGMRSILLRATDHAFATVDDAVVSPIALPRVTRMFSEYPRLAAAVLWAISRDEAILVEHLVGLGRRSAIERTAHFFLELKDRLSLAGMSDGAGFECPLNQYLLSDALGLTAIHLNRVLRQLRERGLMTMKDDRIAIDDLKGLTKLAGYEDAYLDHQNPSVAAAS